MDPFSAIAGGASAVLGPIFGLIGGLFAKGDRDEAERLRKKAMEQYNIDLPPVEQIHAQTVDKNAFDNIAEDPRLRGAEMDALNSLQDISKSGGLRAQDKARMAELVSDTNTRERGAREAILQNANARGMGGSSAELQTLLANQQGSADRASQQGMDIAAQAEQAALDSIGKGADLASNIRGEDYAKEAAKAGAANTLGQFNAGQRQETNVFNVGQNQQRFENETTLADRRAAGYEDQAAAKEGRAQQTQATFGGIGQAAGAAAGAAGQYAAYQDWLNRRKVA